MDGRLSLIFVKISIAGKSVGSEKAVSGKNSKTGVGIQENEIVQLLKTNQRQVL